MSWFTRTRIEIGTSPVRSLCWRGDELVDWVRGGDRWELDGRFHSAKRSWGYGRFDGAIADPSGRWAFVHERTGTAALLLHDGKVVRAVHRAPYHADAYLYPACLFHLDGRVLLAHCPDSYARIEIDDAETGERLTRSDSREVADFFHSRLAASPRAKRLVSAGWVWHPLDAIVWFDIVAAIADPRLLDSFDGSADTRNVCLAEHSSAAWIDDDRIVIGSSAEPEDAEEASEADRERPGPRLKPTGLAVYDIASRACVTSVELGYPPGVMMPVGAGHVLTFFRRPRLVSLATGSVVHEWSDIASGQLVSSIVHSEVDPPLALDPVRPRFAVAGPGGIDLICFDVSALPV